MYHHYRDFADLMDRALVARLRVVVDVVIAAVHGVVTGSATAEQLRSGLLALLREAQGPAQSARRARHVWLIAQAGVRDSMRVELAVEQQRLTGSLAASLEVAQEFGWVTRELDARALVVLAQACALGRVIDDVVDEPLDPVTWDGVLRHLLDSVVVTAPRSSIGAQASSSRAEASAGNPAFRAARPATSH
jgi:AcrR family transcriptional regulator